MIFMSVSPFDKEGHGKQKNIGTAKDRFTSLDLCPTFNRSSLVMSLGLFSWHHDTAPGSKVTSQETDFEDFGIFGQVAPMFPDYSMFG